MDRSTAQTALIAVLGIVALALVAATLTSTITPEQTGLGIGDSDAGGSTDGGLLPQPTPREPLQPIEIPYLTLLLKAILVMVAIAMAVYLYLYRREAFRMLVLITAFFGLVYLFARLLALFEPGFPSFGSRGSGLFGGGSGLGSGTATAPQPVVLLVLLGVAVVGVVLAIRRTDDGISDANGESPSPEAAAVGQAAGRAAKSLERDDVTVGNAVYRAWHEMTELLDVSHPATTPGEFAVAAVDAGMDRDDVTELTRLFEDVRYGGYEPTQEDERRALAVLRRIESAYAPADGAEP